MLLCGSGLSFGHETFQHRMHREYPVSVQENPLFVLWGLG